MWPAARNPTGPLTLSPRVRAGLTATYTFQPLSNLVYTRDQQITTCKGIVMGRLRSPQRNLEVTLMKFCLQKLGGWGAAACTTTAARLLGLAAGDTRARLRRHGIPVASAAQGSQ